MIREKIRQFIEQLVEAHTIITRQPWVLWNDIEEER